MNTKIIKLDINKNLYDILVAKQGDTKSRFLLFNLLDGSIPFSLENRSVRVYAIKPDGTEVFNDLIITDAAKGYCILELTTQILAVAGTVKLELMIIENEKKLTSNIFYMSVKESINSEKAIVSTNEFGALLTALSSLNEYDNYKKEIAAARDGEANLLTKVKKIDEQLDNNVHIINSIAYVDVTRFAGVNDSEKLRNAFSYIINLDNNYTKKLTTSKILEINESVVLDFGWKKGYEIDLQITPNGGIGNAITITKAIGLKGKLDVIGGGNDTNTDIAYLVNHLHHCKLEIFGSYYKGTIFSANGKEADYSRCIGMEIKLRNYNCNRSFFIGDKTYPSAGFGTITELWEETWDSSKAVGSEVIGVSDISFPHYESHFITNEENQTNLFLNGCKSVYFGYLALGGKCKQLFKLGYNCDVTIDSLHLGSEDGNSVNGVYIGQESDLFVRFCKGIAVGTLVECKNAGSVYFDILRPNPEVDKVVIYNGQDLGYGKKIMSFSNVEKANYKQNNIYQVYKENFATAPSSVADTDRTLNTLKRCNELYASLSNTKDDVIYNSSNAIACQINEGAVIGSFGELRFDTTCNASETIVCNLDFKVTNFAEGGMVKIAIEYYDSGWNLIATGYERVMDRNNYLSFQQFNFEPFSLIADNPPSNVAYARFTIKIKRATSNTTRLCLSAFSVRKKLIL